MKLPSQKNDSDLGEYKEDERRRQPRGELSSPKTPFVYPTQGRRGTLFTLAGAALGLVVGTNAGLASSQATRKVLSTVSEFSASARRILFDRVLSFGTKHGSKAVASEELAEWIASQSVALEYPEIATWLAAQQVLRESAVGMSVAATESAAEIAATTLAASAAATKAASVGNTKDESVPSARKPNNACTFQERDDGDDASVLTVAATVAIDDSCSPTKARNKNNGTCSNTFLSIERNPDTKTSTTGRIVADGSDDDELTVASERGGIQ